MESIFVFLIRNDVWIYILAALGLAWYFAELIRGRNLLRRAMFGLERERGLRMRNNALFFVTLFLVVIGIVFFVNRNIAPTISPDKLKPPTPTPDIFHTPLSSPTPLEEMADQATSTPPLVATVTLPRPPGAPDELDETPTTEQPTETAVPPTPFTACNVDLNINQPANGAVVTGDISFFGTAATENMEYYTIEVNGPQTNGQWADVLGRRIEQQVDDSFLGSANLSQWEGGPYLVRLTAVDTGENMTGQCMIQITISY